MDFYRKRNVINLNGKFVLISRLIGSLKRYIFHHSFICEIYFAHLLFENQLYVVLNVNALAWESVYWTVMFPRTGWDLSFDVSFDFRAVCSGNLLWPNQLEHLCVSWPQSWVGCCGRNRLLINQPNLTNKYLMMTSTRYSIPVDRVRKNGSSCVSKCYTRKKWWEIQERISRCQMIF